jgi:hypothetical protein
VNRVRSGNKGKEGLRMLVIKVLRLDTGPKTQEVGIKIDNIT